MEKPKQEVKNKKEDDDSKKKLGRPSKSMHEIQQINRKVNENPNELELEMQEVTRNLSSDIYTKLTLLVYDLGFNQADGFNEFIRGIEQPVANIDKKFFH